MLIFSYWTEEVESSEPTEVIEMKTPTCRSCGSESVVKAGWKYNRNGRKRRFPYKACSRHFTVNDGFLRMRVKPATITVVIDLCYVSKSVRKARNWLARHFHEFPLSHVSIWRWVHKFTSWKGPTRLFYMSRDF